MSLLIARREIFNGKVRKKNVTWIFDSYRATKILHTRGETPILDANSGNPFAERPSTARQNMMQRRALDTALTDLDKPGNMPEGVDDEAWSRLCRYRRQKIESEMLVS